MRRTILGAGLAVLLIGSAAGYYLLRARATTLVLTGLVTTNDVIVSAQVGGQLARLPVKEGDHVTRGQAIAALTSDEMRADSAYYARTAEGASTQVQQSEAALRFEEEQTKSQIEEAEATVSSAEAQQTSANADLDNAKITFDRTQKLLQAGAATQSDFDQARTAYEAARAKADSLAKQVEAARATVALAKSNAEQVAMRRSQVLAS